MIGYSIFAECWTVSSQIKKSVLKRQGYNYHGQSVWVSRKFYREYKLLLTIIIKKEGLANSTLIRHFKGMRTKVCSASNIASLLKWMVEQGPKRVWVKIYDLLRATKSWRTEGPWSPPCVLKKKHVAWKIWRQKRNG